MIYVSDNVQLLTSLAEHTILLPSFYNISITLCLIATDQTQHFLLILSPSSFSLEDLKESVKMSEQFLVLCHSYYTCLINL